MQRSIYQHKILDSLAPTGDDLKVLNRYLYINGKLMWKMDDVERNGVVKETAITSETLGVLTFVLPAVPTNSTVYTIQVSVAIPSPTGTQVNPLVVPISVKTPDTGSLTNITLAAQFVAAINATYSQLATYVTATAPGVDLIVTAKAGYPVIIGNATSPITVTLSTPGIAKRGLPANMLVLGVTLTAQNGNFTNTEWLGGTAGTLAGTSYTLYYCNSALDIGENNTARLNQLYQQCLWVANNATNGSTFITNLDSILSGFLKDDSTLNYHELEVNQTTHTTQ